MKRPVYTHTHTHTHIYIYMYMYWKKAMQMQDYITKDLQEIERNVVYWVYLGGDR